MDYTAFVQALLILTSRASAANGYAAPTDFTNILPQAINYAEDRIYREMVFLATRAQDASLMFTPGSRTLGLQSMTTVIIVPEGLSAITPLGALPALGTRLGFGWATLDFIDVCWPTESLTQAPALSDNRWWTMRDAQTIICSPTMDQAYVAEVTGLFRPLQLSAANPNTYLTTSYPDLMLAASMIFMSAYLRNFGAQADNPQMSQSWEAQYKVLAASATLEEQRRRGQGQGWSQNAPTPLATPQRTG